MNFRPAQAYHHKTIVKGFLFVMRGRWRAEFWTVLKSWIVIKCKVHFLAHGRCEASFVSLCYQTRLPWRTKLLCAQRGYAAEPSSLKRGCWQFRDQLLKKWDRNWVTWASFVAYYRLCCSVISRPTKRDWAPGGGGGVGYTSISLTGMLV